MTPIQAERLLATAFFAGLVAILFYPLALVL